MSVTTIEVQRRTDKRAAEREAAKLNALAFSGQRYSVDKLDVSTFAIVLTDTDRADNRPAITGCEPRERFTSRDFTAMAGKRMHGDMRGSGEYMVHG